MKHLSPIVLFFLCGFCSSYAQTVDVTDIPLYTTTDSLYSENSIFISPLDKAKILTATNMHEYNNPNCPSNAVNGFISTDGGSTWTNPISYSYSVYDPACVIDRNGYYYATYISDYFPTYRKAIIAKSTNGTTWTYDTINPTQNFHVDKEHLWVDNREYKSDGSANSTYKNYLYAGWNPESGSATLYAAYSSDGGQNWQGTTDIYNGSSNTIGINLQTGPDGDVYACWNIMGSVPTRSTDIGFNMSGPGAQSWNTNYSYAVQNIYGIWGEYLGGNGNTMTMKAKTMPSMTVNQQNGYIFIVWTNRGVPGTNTGNLDIYMVYSTNEGASWSSPIKVNTNDGSNSSDQWFPWIACDEASGALVCVYYDTRDFSFNAAYTYASISYDQGNTWQQYRISDIGNSFSGDGYCTTAYAGDYIGVDVYHGSAVAVWTDDRTGNLLSYVNPFDVPCPSTLSLTYGDYNITNEKTGTNFTYDAAYSASTTIDVAGGTTDYKIYNGANAYMSAGTSITLNEGFECNGEFTADIGSCTDFSQRMGGNDNSSAQSQSSQSPFNASAFPVRVFPNPSTDGIVKSYVPIVDADDQDKTEIPTAIISIYNSMGETIYHAQAIEWISEINLSSQPNGLYLINVTKGDKVYNGKIILK